MPTRTPILYAGMSVLVNSIRAWDIRRLIRYFLGEKDVYFLNCLQLLERVLIDGVIFYVIK